MGKCVRNAHFEARNTFIFNMLHADFAQESSMRAGFITTRKRAQIDAGAILNAP